MAKNKIIKQKKHHDLIIDTDDKSIISITIDSFFNGWETIEIERSNIPKLIKILQKEIEKK